MDVITDERVGKGGILVKMYFDMQEKDKEKLQPLLVDLLNNRLLKEKGVVFGYGKINEPLERDGTFITSAIITILFDSIIPLANVVFSYAPAAIEVLKPEKEFALKSAELQSLLLDLSNVSIMYSRYILENVLKPEELQKIRQQLQNRAELGKKLLDSSKSNGEKK